MELNKEKNPAPGAEPLTLAQRQGYTDLVRHMIETVGMYLAYAIEMAMEDAGVDRQVFWKNLFKTETEKGILEDRGKTKKNVLPHKPCHRMDYQACAKFIAFGNQRVLDHSRLLLEYFDVARAFLPMGDLDQYAVYRSFAESCTRVRNDYMHMTLEFLQGITNVSIWEVQSKLERLTAPLKRRTATGREPKFGELPQLDVFWSGIKEKLTEMAGPAPISLKDFGAELFCVESMTEELRDDLVATLGRFGISRENGRLMDGFILGERDRRELFILGEPDRRELMGKLRYDNAIARRLGQQTGADSPEQCEDRWAQEKQAQAEAKAKTFPEQAEPRWKPEESRQLAVSAAGAVLGEAELRILLSRFNIVLEESILLNSDGRHGLEDLLLPRLMGRQGQRAPGALLMDQSSVTGLFRALRESRPMEAGEIDGEDWDAELEAARDWQHQQCKKAIGGTLQNLHRAGCLRIGRSPLGDEPSFENIRRVAEEHPETKFLVLTCSETAARTLAGAYSRNLAAGRLLRDGEDGFVLQILEPTRKNWADMMDVTPGPEGDGLDRRIDALAALRETDDPENRSVIRQLMDQVRPRTEAEREPDSLEGTALETTDRAGNPVTLTLGPIIGAGGEGTIYAVAGPEGYETLAVKVYKPENRSPVRLEKLNYMLAHDPGVEALCWPRALVSRDGEWVGFVMARAQGEPLAHTVYLPGKGCENIKNKLGWDRRTLVRAAAAIAQAFADMHRCGILMGDINPRNILADRDGTVRLVDCDSYQVGDYACPVGMLQYVPPEELRRTEEEALDFGFLRTEHHERYSLAVLLFEVLMLGKPPYVSKTNNPTQIREAVLSGIFPYRYDLGEEEQNEEDEEEYRSRLERQGILAPSGVWKLIWSNMPRSVKTDFYQTFKENKRRSAQDWVKSMKRYGADLGEDSAPLVPRSYKKFYGAEYETVRCEECGEEFTILKRILEDVRAKKQPVLCPYHGEIQQILNHMEDTQRCEQCGRFYLEKVRRILRPDFRPLCEKCGTVPDQCQVCGTRIRIGVALREELKKQGRPILCQEHRKVTVPCNHCGEPVELSRHRYQQKVKNGEPIYCGKHSCAYVQTKCGRCGAEMEQYRPKYEDLRAQGREPWCEDCQKGVRK